MNLDFYCFWLLIDMLPLKTNNVSVPTVRNWNLKSNYQKEQIKMLPVRIRNTERNKKVQLAVSQNWALCHLINDAGWCSLAREGAQVAAGAGGGLADVLQPLVDVTNLSGLRVLHVLPEQWGGRRDLNNNAQGFHCRCRKQVWLRSTVADPCHFRTDPDPTPAKNIGTGTSHTDPDPQQMGHRVKATGSRLFPILWPWLPYLTSLPEKYVNGSANSQRHLKKLKQKPGGTLIPA
jgi:hypothetical protein